MNKARSPINKNIETAVSELLDSKAESRIYIYLLRKNRARSDDIIRGTKLHPSTVRELLSKMYENRIIFREKIQTDTIGKNPYLYGAISPLLLLQRRVKIIESRLNTIANLAGKTNGSKYVQIRIDHEGGER
jgi:predicted DNA-binding transcriptional regulator